MLEFLRGCVRTSLRREVVASGLLLPSDVTASVLIFFSFSVDYYAELTFVAIASSLLP